MQDLKATTPSQVADELTIVQGEHPTPEQYMNVAARWINDPFNTRVEMVAQILGIQDPEKPATIQDAIKAMSRATLSHASSLAWMRGERTTIFGPLARCPHCTNFVEEHHSVKLEDQIIVSTIWFGADYGRWRCSVCGGDVDTGTFVIPDPVISEDMRELKN